ncbi:MAG: hypothetical protein CVV52_19435, partial [Spirochaetae bacterium HGW-Spirochaetae-8]
MSRSNLGSTDDPYIGISINPFFSYNAFSIGMQAYFLTDGSLTSVSTWDFTNLDFDFSSVLGGIRTALKFIDFIKYGSDGDVFHLVANDQTPISFGKKIMVNHMAIASGPFERNLGLYSKGGSGWWGYELFLDNVYLDNIVANDALSNQFGGLGLIVTPNPNGYRFAIGLSSLFKINPAATTQLVAYPTLDLTFPIKNERKLQAEAYVSATTALNLFPFEFTT